MVSKYFMELAIRYAKDGLAKSEVPVGAVVVYNQEVISGAHNQVMSNNNVIHHAEILALEIAMKTLNTRYLNDCDLYVTLEPCPMCAQAIAFARIRRLYFSVLDPKGGGVYRMPCIFNYTNHVPEVYEGILSEQSGELLKRFFSKLRSKI
ncbi:MAG: cytosine deaminase [Candidatus Xenolissoclinum pacificiensis L6]|uniref:tRNA-specific adenosine deaminase n=1 Tax=Candidatus Xenolissoclinum pacificiensis L6 TaxID=1401685 RepID=W2V2M7_9RICK|nr:MAG: cytosine deaminase [Candidatus Xenolissoclinum pacificiensis L6]